LDKASKGLKTTIKGGREHKEELQKRLSRYFYQKSQSIEKIF
jgi:hypothetical protein